MQTTVWLRKFPQYWRMVQETLYMRQQHLISASVPWTVRRPVQYPRSRLLKDVYKNNQRGFMNRRNKRRKHLRKCKLSHRYPGLIFKWNTWWTCQHVFESGSLVQWLLDEDDRDITGVYYLHGTGPALSHIRNEPAWLEVYEKPNNCMPLVSSWLAIVTKKGCLALGIGVL